MRGPGALPARWDEAALLPLPAQPEQQGPGHTLLSATSSLTRCFGAAVCVHGPVHRAEGGLLAPCGEVAPHGGGTAREPHQARALLPASSRLKPRRLRQTRCR